MSYKNLVAQPIASRSEVFKRFRDWLCARNGSYDYSTTGLGWTLHDSSYATSEHTPASNDYFVAKSVGESGSEDLYVKVVYSATSGYITIQMYQYWNATTHTGVNGMSAANNLSVAEASSGTLYIYGNLDFFCILTYIGSSKYGAVFGVVDNAFYDRATAICSSAVAAGLNVVVTLDVVPESWEVGGRVVVRDDANMERITIAAIDGLNVTFISVVANYAAGCKFAQDYPVVCSAGANLASSFSALFGHQGTKQTTVAAVPIPTMPGTSGDPDALDGDYVAAPVEVGDGTSGYYGAFQYILGATTGYTDLGVYTTPDGVNYRAFISLYSGWAILIKEV